MHGRSSHVTKTKIERPDLLEIAAMRARWKEERAAGATCETFARWRVRIKAEVLDELRKVLDDDRRRWPVRASAISASRSGVSALAQCSHAKGLAGSDDWLAEIFGLGAPARRLEVRRA